MTFDISVFAAEVQSGFQKPSRYRVRFPIPNAFQGAAMFTNNLQSLEYFADSAQLVDAGFLARNIVRYGYGASEKKPFAPSFNDIMITFYNDSQSTNLGFFQQWLSAVQTFDMSKGIVNQAPHNADWAVQPYEIFYKDQYVVDGQITLIDNNDNDVVTYRMRRMWPLHLAPTRLGWAVVNDVMKLTVIFNYTDWYIDVNQGGLLLDYYKSLQNAGQTSQQQTAVQEYLSQLYNPFGFFTVPSAVPQ